MTNPIDVLEEALRLAEQQHKEQNDPTSKYWGYRSYAKVAADTLTSDEAVAIAVEALVADGWLDADRLTRENVDHIARVVLGSIGGA